jgi:hypothetical protein
MPHDMERVRASATEAKQIIAELSDLLNAIDPNLPLRVSGRYALGSLGINVLLGLEATQCGGACTGCLGCEGGCRGCKGPSQMLVDLGSQFVNPNPTAIVEPVAGGG